MHFPYIIQKNTLGTKEQKNIRRNIFKNVMFVWPLKVCQRILMYRIVCGVSHKSLLNTPAQKRLA